MVTCLFSNHSPTPTADFKYEKVRVCFNRQIQPGYYQLTFLSPAIENVSLPGQFVNVKCGSEPYLRRPFSIAAVDNRKITILYKVVGRGTEWLSSRNPNDQLDVIGPLGNGYTLPTELFNDKSVRFVLLAGGTGIASILFLGHWLQKNGYQNRTTILYGCRSKRDLCNLISNHKFTGTFKIVTDDGTCGMKGNTITLLLKHLHLFNETNNIRLYTCGPKPMLKVVTEICRKNHIWGEVSLEEWIACGIGECRGCIIKIRPDARGMKNTADIVYRSVCKDGPVFPIQDVVW